MSARVFLELLLKEYRNSHLYVVANLLQWALNGLIEGDPGKSLASITSSEEFLLGEMHRHPEIVNSYTRDLALLRAVKTMIESKDL